MEPKKYSDVLPEKEAGKLIKKNKKFYHNSMVLLYEVEIKP